MSQTPFQDASAPALSAFLRGVERRGFVVARLQCGDAGLAEQGLAAAFRAFRGAAGRELMANWPVRFWSLLAAVPALRSAAPAVTPGGAFASLPGIAAADRLALLLRIVAGLDEPMAADVLGIDEETYRQALARACPRDPQGQPDAQAWRALADAAQREVRELPGERLAQLARLREGMLDEGRPVAERAAASTDARSPAAAAAKGARRPAPPPAGRHGSRRWLLAGAVLVLILGALAMWRWIERPPALPPEPVSQALPGALHVVDAAPVLVEELPPGDESSAPAPMQAIDPADMAMLADPELDTARDADLYGWIAAGAPVPADESDPRPVPGTDGPGLETVDDGN